MLALTRTIEQSDWLRRSPVRFGGRGAHKEWLHFCVYAGDVDVLVNLSVLDDLRPGAHAAELARTTLLVRTESGWTGEVQSHPATEVELASGRIAARLGANHVRFEDGVYTLSARGCDTSLAVDVSLRPVTMPSIINNVQVGDGPPINWLVVPRLVADGEITVAGRRHVVRGALAYHDHNWGHFGWGRDFAWEWGYGLPADPANPWSLVFVRLSDRAHTRAMMQGAFLWKGLREQRVFRDGALTVRHHDLLRPTRLCKVPAVMSLIHPQLATDIPRELEFSGAIDGDTIDGRFRGEDVAQVLVPNDRDFGVTVINEVSGHLTVQAQIRGETVSIDGRAIFEFLGA